MADRVVLALFLLAATAPVAGAETLEEVVAKNLRARGGLEKLLAVRTARMTGRITFGPGMQAPFTLERKRPRLMRTEFTLDGKLCVQAFDGQVAWTQMPFMGQTTPEPVADGDRGQIEEQADFDGPLVDWKAKGHTLELLGKQTLEGSPAWRLKLTTKSGSVRHVLLDATSFLELRVLDTRSFQGEELEFESSLSDYRDVDGIQVPFLVESGPKGAKERQSISFDKVEFGVAIDDARFRMAGRER